jgi:hypothetical protein
LRALLARLRPAPAPRMAVRPPVPPLREPVRRPLPAERLPPLRDWDFFAALPPVFFLRRWYACS